VRHTVSARNIIGCDRFTDPLVSPINGSLDGLPPTVVYSSSLDALSADSLRLQANAVASGADVTFILKQGLVHDWEFLGGPDPDWSAICSQLGLEGSSDRDNS
jgi:triacylglycerol lipase